MSSMEDFGGGQLIVGAAYAKRAFIVAGPDAEWWEAWASELQLRSVVRDYRWQEGENVASCVYNNTGLPRENQQVVKIEPYDETNAEHRQARQAMQGSGSPLSHYVTQDMWVMYDHWNQTVAYVKSESAPLGHPEGHKLCRCGFYAYWYDMENEYADNLRYVEGIVKCTGHVTAGSYGLRAQKAEIVALVEPKSFSGESSSPKQDGWFKRKWHKLLRFVYDQEDLLWKGEFTAFVVGFIAGIALAVRTQSPVCLAPIALGFVVLIAGIVLDSAAYRHVMRQWNRPSRTDEFRESLKMGREEWEGILKLFPNVKVYKTFADAAKDFPMTFRPESAEEVNA